MEPPQTAAAAGAGATPSSISCRRLETALLPVASITSPMSVCSAQDCPTSPPPHCPVSNQPTVCPLEPSYSAPGILRTHTFQVSRQVGGWWQLQVVLTTPCCSPSQLSVLAVRPRSLLSSLRYGCARDSPSATPPATSGFLLFRLTPYMWRLPWALCEVTGRLLGSGYSQQQPGLSAAAAPPAKTL